MEILSPDHPVLRRPNAITLADFDGWVERRGSKFFSKGHYTYFAYALHRQLPYGVPGAYRLLANLLSLGRTTAPAASSNASGPSPRGARVTY